MLNFNFNKKNHNISSAYNVILLSCIASQSIEILINIEIEFYRCLFDIVYF